MRSGKRRLPLKGKGLRFLHTSQPGAVSLGVCPNFVVFYWQSHTLLCSIIFHITAHKMFPQDTVLCEVPIKWYVSVRKKYHMKLMPKQKRLTSMFQGILGEVHLIPVSMCHPESGHVRYSGKRGC